MAAPLARSLTQQLAKPLTQPQVGTYTRKTGVNLSALEYAWQVSPTQANINYVAGRGLYVVRVPFAWERMQPVLGSALDATFLAQYTAVVDALLAKGCTVILDCHNYGTWDPQFDPIAGSPAGTYNHGYPDANASAYRMGSANLTQAHFVDLWTRMATAFVGKTNIIYDLMNEPYNLTGSNLLRSSNHFANDFGTNPWVRNGSEVLESRMAVSLSGKNDVWRIDDGANFGGIQRTVTMQNIQYTLSWEAFTASGSLSANLGVDFSDWTPITVTTTKQRFSKTFTPTAGNHSIQFTMNTNNRSKVFIANACLQTGVGTNYIGDVWPLAAQAAINAIRAIDTTHTIHVAGDELGRTSDWAKANVNLFDLTDSANKLVFDGHCYFDDGSSAYAGDYDTIVAADSFGSGSTRGINKVAPFVDAAAAAGKDYFVSEFGTPGNDARWGDVLSGFYSKLGTDKVRSCWWVYSTHKPGDPSSIQEGTAANTNLGRDNFSDAPQLAWIR